jgi:chromosome segregation ATPase
MIKNDIEYEFSKEQAAKFEQAIAFLKTDKAKLEREPMALQSLIDSHQSQLESIQDEIVEYETLIAHDSIQPVVLALDDINQLSEILIKARIALKMTHKELAFLCDRTEQQIKAYEDKEYQNASFVDVLTVINALGIQLDQGKFLVSLDDFYSNRLAELRQNEYSTIG